MKKLTIQAYERKEFKKKSARKLVSQGYLPGVLYGGKGKENTTFAFFIKALDIAPLNYEAFFITLVLNAKEYPCILQAKQIRPVSGIPMHIDCLRMFDDQPITMRIPLHLVGNAVGVGKGGLLEKKIRWLKVRGLPKDMPEKIEADVSNLDLGQSLQVKDIVVKAYKICNPANSLVAFIKIPRALRSKAGQEKTKA